MATSTYNNGEPSTASVTVPIAIMMGMASNPTVYAAANLTSIIEGDSVSNDSVSTTVFDPAILCIIHTSLVLMAPHEDIALLTVPHLQWQCSVSSADNEFPVTFNALIDHGANTVFISNEFMSSLSLK